ncbi:MAG: hypothetical protein KF912_14205 [Phycisphaeraceae bacterium]|nr:hypothetical protein [Phycisphaeraceae bacterium]MBX3368458.1 hypothetical protein [Phycisphaeraceae bacterium]
MRAHGLSLILSISLLAASGADAQQASPRGVQPASQPPVAPARAASDVNDPARLRESLERRRDVAESMRARLDEAIARLDRGEAIDPGLVEGRAPFGGPDDNWADGPRGARVGRPEGRENPVGRPGEGGDVISNEEIRRLRGFIDENLPLLAERLRASERMDPQAAQRMITRIAPRLREALESRARSPEVFRIRVVELEQGFQLLELARRTRRIVETEGAESQEAMAAMASFREHATAHFDTQIRLQRAEVAELESRLLELRAEIDRRTSQREAEIDARVEDVLRSSRPDRPQGANRPDRTPPGEGQRRRPGPE